MNTLIKIIITTISLTFAVGVFASDTDKDLPSDKNQSGSTIDNKDDNQEELADDTTKEEITEAKKEKIKQEISSYIIESYKAQGDKILKDIDQTLQKTVSDRNDRVEAYKKIRTSLEARRTRNNASKKISESSKMIVNEFLTHMIDSIDKKISELSK